ncbi:MAG: Ig domain-containing protein [Bacilli bacterium]|nr:Ig domain-containing protein [Bacilli bacterium]
MNKKILLLLPALTLVLAGCNNQNKGKSTPSSDSGEVVGVESVTVTPNTLNLEAGQTATLAATVKPVSVENKDVVWSTNNPAAATVDASGKVTAVGEGTAVITATSDADETKKGTCTVGVTEPLFKPVKNPVLEKTFKFGTYQENLLKRIFFNGEEEAYPRLHTTDLYDEAVDVYFEAVEGKEGKYYVAFGEGTGKKYIGLSQNQGTADKPSYRIGTVGAHSYDGKNFEITMEDAEWDWDGVNYTIKQTRGDESYFPGTYNSFDTISGCAYAKLADDFVFQFLTLNRTSLVGPDVVFAGMTAQYQLLLPDGEEGTPVWSLTPASEKVTIDSSTGVVTAAADAEAGSKFTVSVSWGEGEDKQLSKEIEVKSINYGTLEEPLTTAEAKEVIDMQQPTAELIYVKGVVKANDAYSGGQWFKVWLDGTTDDTGFEGFKLKDGSTGSEYSKTFTAKNSLVGYEVVICGIGSKYNSTYETDGTDSSKLMLVKDIPYSSTIAINPSEDFELGQGDDTQLTAIFEEGKVGAAVWSVEPVEGATEGKAEISETGKLVFAEDAVIGEKYKVTAALFNDETVKANVVVTVKASSTSKATLDVSDANWPTAQETTATAHTIGGVAVMTCGLNKDTSGSAQAGGDIFMKKGVGYIYNSASLGKIVSIAVTFSGNSSAGKLVCISLGSSALNTRDTSEENAKTFAKGETITVTNETDGIGYFNVSNNQGTSSSAKNIRIVSIVVKYIPA